LNFLQNLK